MLPETTKQRIEQEAHNSYPDNEPYDNTYYSISNIRYHEEQAYIAGATLCAERAEKLERENRELKERGEKMAITLQIIHDIKDFTDKEGFVQQLCKSALKEK